MTLAPRLLVVGGSGFIGSHIVGHAARLGWDVTALGLSRRPDHAVANVRRVVADVTDNASLRAALVNTTFDYVVNGGGYIDHTPFLRGGRKVLTTHFDGVCNLIEVLGHGALRSFVNLGSSDEYGDAPAPQSEHAREAPISPYAVGKVAATHFLQMLHRTEQFPSTTLRLFLTYGPCQDDRRFLPQVIKGCLDGRSFAASAGEQVRDFCYVQDTVDAVFAALTCPAARGEVINIGSGQPVTIREVTETVRRLVGRGLPQFGAIAYRPAENMRLFADVSKAKALLGWEPKMPLETGLQLTTQWITAHR